MKRTFVLVSLTIVFGVADLLWAVVPEDHFYETFTRTTLADKILFRLDKIYLQEEGLFAVRAKIPRPTQEVKAGLVRLIKKYPEIPELYKRLADVELLLGDFESAQNDILKFVRIARSDKTSLPVLADFWHSRLEYNKELAVWERVTSLLEREKEKDKAKLKEVYTKIINLIKTNLLTQFDKYKYFKRLIAIFPDDFTFVKNYLNELVTDKKYKVFLSEVDYYQKKFPLEKRYFLKIKSQLYEKQNEKEKAEQVYKAVLQPTTDSEIYRDYFRLLRRLRKYAPDKRKLLNKLQYGQPTKKDVVLAFYFYWNEWDYKKAAEILSSWVEKLSELSDETLLLVGDLYAKIHYRALAAKYYYTLYLSSDEAQLREEALFKFFTCLNLGGKESSPYSNCNLKTYLSQRHFDTNPSIYGGIISLLLNDTKYYKRLEDLKGVFAEYENKRLAYHIYTKFREQFPRSDYLPIIFAEVINMVYGYQDYELTVTLGYKFVSQFPRDVHFYDSYLLIARAYAQRGEKIKEWEVFQKLLDISASRGDEDKYEMIFREYVGSLTRQKKYLDVIKLYWAEIEKHPEDEKLYNEFLNFVERHNLYEEELSVYEKAVKHFDDKSWYHKLARWYIRHKGRKAFEDITRDIKDVFKDTELMKYLQEFVSFDWNHRDAAKSQFYLNMYLYAHQKFPRNVGFVKGLLKFYDRFYSYYKLEFENLSKEYLVYDEEIRTGLFRHLMAEGKLRLAVRKLKSKSPLNLAENSFLAYSLAWLSCYEEALPYFEKLAVNYPGNREINEKLDSLYRSFQKTEESAQGYTKLAKIYPDNKNYYTKAGEVWAESNYFEKASFIWDKILRIIPGSESNYLEVATIYWDYYQFTRAAETFKSIRDIKAQPLLYATKLAAVYECMKDYHSAIFEYIRVISSQPRGNANIKIRLKYLAKNKNLEKEIKDSFESLMKLQPENSNVVLAYADFLSRIGQEDARRNLYEKSYDKYENLDFLQELFNYAASNGLLGFQEVLLKQMIKISEEKRWYYLRLANFYEKNKQYQKAEKTYEDLIKEYSKIGEPAEYLQVLQEASNYFWRKKKYERSLALLNESLKIVTPDRKENLLHQLAQKYIEREKYDAASEILKKLIKEHPLNPNYFNTLAQVYTKLNNFEALIGLYRTGIENVKKSDLERDLKKSKIAELRSGLIDCYIELERFRPAQDQYIEIINRQPLVEKYLGEAYEFSKKHGLKERLIKYYLRTSKKSFKNYRWNFVLANFYIYDRKFDKAIAQFKKAINNEPQRLNLYLLLVDLYLKMNNYVEAIKTYEEVYKLDNKNPKWLVKIAQLYARIGRKDEALTTAKRLVEGNPPEFGRYFEVAGLLESWEMTEQAIDYLNRGIDKFVKDPYKQNLTREDVETYIRINLKVGNYARVFNTLLELQEILRSELKKRRFEPWKIRSSFNSVKYGVSDILGAKVREYARDTDAREMINLTQKYFDQHPEVPFETYDLYINFAKNAGLPELEENLMMQLLNYCFQRRKRYNQYWNRYYQMVDKLGNFYEQRKNYTKAIEFLTREKLRDKDGDKLRIWCLQLAHFHRALGDDSGEQKALAEYYSRTSGRGANLKTEFEREDENIGRYFSLCLKRKQFMELENLASKYTRHTGQLLNFLTKKNQLELALKTVDEGCSREPPVWKNTKKALIYLYFKKPEAVTKELFTDFLNIMPIGEQVATPIDRDTDLIEKEWYIFAKHYGEFLKLAADPLYPKYLVAKIEDSPLSPYQQELLGDFYLEAQDYQQALRYYRLAQHFKPRDNILFASIGKTYLKMDKKELAFQEWAKIIEKAKANLDDYNFYFHTLRENGFDRKGLQTFQEQIMGVFKETNFGVLKSHLKDLENYYREKDEMSVWLEYLKSLDRIKLNSLLLPEYVISHELVEKRDIRFFYERILAFLFGQKEPNARLIEKWRKQFLNYTIEVKNYMDALRLINALSQPYEPVEIPVWIVEQKGKVFLKMGRKEEAVKVLSSIYAEKKKNRQNYLKVYDILKEEGAEKEAKDILFEMYTWLIEEKTKSNADYIGLAELQLEKGQSEKAFTLIEDMVKLYPDNKEGLKSAAELLTKFNFFEKAQNYRGILSKIDPNDYDNKVELARLIYLTHKKREGIRQLEYLLPRKTVPNRVKVKICEVMPELLKEDKDISKSELEIVKKIVELRPDEHYYLLLARLYKIRGKTNEYEKALRQAVGKLLSPYQICCELAKLYEENNRKKEAAVFYKKALSIEPDNYLLNIVLFNLYYDMQEYQTAIEMARGKVELQHQRNYYDLNRRDQIYSPRRIPWYYRNLYDKLEIERSTLLDFLSKRIDAHLRLGEYKQAIFYEKLKKEYTGEELEKKECERRIKALEEKIKQKAEEEKKILKIKYALANI